MWRSSAVFSWERATLTPNVCAFQVPMTGAYSRWHSEPGGFYFPVLDDAAAAYLAEKPEHSAFDGVIADYLDGSITGTIEAVGLHVGEIYLQQEV